MEFSLAPMEGITGYVTRNAFHHNFDYIDKYYNFPLNLKVKQEKVKVTKEEVKTRIDNLLKGYAELVVKENGKVENGDIAVIDFEGFKDEVAFEGN